MPSAFTRNLVYPLYWRYRGLRVGKLIPFYMQNQWRSLGELQEAQWTGLKRLLSHAYRTVPYYRRSMRELGCRPDDIQSQEDFALLPLLTKDDILQAGSDLLSHAVPRRRLIEDSTGGSTGKNIRFFEDRHELAHRFAAVIRCDRWAGMKLGDRYAQIWGSPLDLAKASPFRRMVDQILLGRLFISSFRLSDADLAEAVPRMAAFNPQTLIGYPTPLHRFAGYLAQARIADLGIRSVISSAETLLPRQREDIERQFGCRVFDRYGCREFGVIANECEYHQGFHLMIDRLVLEFVKLPGLEAHESLFEIVVTDLHKYGMPLIRYRIGDLGLPTDRPCACGRGLPLMEKLQGRTFDLIVGTNGNYVAGTLWTLLFRTIPAIEAFQVVQERREHLEIRLKPRGALNPSHLARLETLIKDRCGNDMQIEFKLVSRLPVNASGKHRFIISSIADALFS